MPTEKRHMYETGTINVETGNVAVKHDINYYNSNTQSVTRSIIRYIEDEGRRFRQNQVGDGLTISNGGTSVNVASGTAYVGGRFVNIVQTVLDATGLNGDYNIIIHVSGVSESTTRDPSSGETVNVFLESSGSWVNDDLKMAIGGANINAGTVNSTIDRSKRRTKTSIILPHGNSTQLELYAGTKPIYRKVVGLTSSLSTFYTDISLSGYNISGSAFNGNNFNIGSKSLGYLEFSNLVGQNQPLKITDSPTFNKITLTGSGAPIVVTGTGTVTNFSADTVRGRTVPAGSTGNLLTETTQQNIQNKYLFDNNVLFVNVTDNSKILKIDASSINTATTRVWKIPDNDDEFAGISGTQTLFNKTIETPTINTPTINDLTNVQHTHENTVGGGILNINNATSGTLSTSKGGTGVTGLTNLGIMLGGTNVTTTAKPSPGQILIGQSGTPVLDIPRILDAGGNVTFNSTSMNAAGDFSLAITVDNDGHTHDTQYYTETEVNGITSTGIADAGRVQCVLMGISGNQPYISSIGYVASNTTYGVYFMYYIPLPLIRGDGKSLTIEANSIKISLNGADTSNYVDQVDFWYELNGTSYITNASTTNYTSPGTYSLTHSAWNINSSTHGYGLRILSSQISAILLTIIGVSVGYYYE